MKAAVSAYPTPFSGAMTRLADFVALAKPRIAVLVLFTVAAGALMAARGLPQWDLLLHALIGAGLVAAGASGGNQLVERETDAMMRRTADRPLPAGRLQPWEVLVYSVVTGLGGLVYLLVFLPNPTAAAIAAFTASSYVFLYTPLKRRTTLNTLVGAVPGALPPLIGWSAIRGTIDAGGWSLFLIVFVWQIPHFLAIAWIYRDEYARAGLCMLPVVDRSGAASGRQMLGYCLALVPASLTPALLGVAGPVYVAGAIGLGLIFLASAWNFSHDRCETRARSVLRASLVYLPGLLALLLLDGAAGMPPAWAWLP